MCASSQVPVGEHTPLDTNSARLGAAAILAAWPPAAPTTTPHNAADHCSRWRSDRAGADGSSRLDPICRRNSTLFPDRRGNELFPGGLHALFEGIASGRFLRCSDGHRTWVGTLALPFSLWACR